MSLLDGNSFNVEYYEVERGDNLGEVNYPASLLRLIIAKP